MASIVATQVSTGASALGVTSSSSVASVSFAAIEVDFDHGVLAHKYVIVGTPSDSGLGQIAIEAIYHALLPGGSIKRVGYLHSSLLAPISGCK